MLSSSPSRYLVSQRAVQSFARSLATLSHPQGRLIVLGTGWGAFSMLRGIDTKQYEVIVISPRNHFVFTPLLASSAVGTLEHRCVIEPIRSLRREIKFFQAKCTSVDFASKTIKCTAATVGEQDNFEMSYDRLVIACGAVSQTFGTKGVREHALFLKEVADARAVRQRIIECFERAQEPNKTEAQVRKLLHFCCVGGGPTSIELAGEMYDLISEDLKRLYPDLADKSSISVFEASDKILTGFDASLTEYAMKKFQCKGITIRYGSAVNEVQENKIVLKNGEEFDFGLLVWSTGVAAAELTKSLNCAKDKAHRIITDEHLRVLSPDGKTIIPNVYALGDCASMQNLPLPSTAQVASQQGIYLAKGLKEIARNKDPSQVQAFKFHNLGLLAYIGSWDALYDAQRKGPLNLSGRFAWVWWRSAYLTMSVSWRSKMLIPTYWFITWVFGRDASRL